MKIVQETEVLTSIEELVDPAQTALLVIDVQNEYCSELGGHAAEVWRAIIPNIQTLLEAARRTGVLVTYTEFIRYSRLGAFLMDGPSNYVHRDDPLVPRIQEGTWEVQTIDELAPRPGEFVFSKSRGSGFVGTGGSDATTGRWPRTRAQARARRLPCPGSPAGPEQRGH
jgi:nicotinamidase-related amidase